MIIILESYYTFCLNSIFKRQQVHVQNYQYEGIDNSEQNNLAISKLYGCIISIELSVIITTDC